MVGVRRVRSHCQREVESEERRLNVEFRRKRVLSPLPAKVGERTAVVKLRLSTSNSDRERERESYCFSPAADQTSKTRWQPDMPSPMACARSVSISARHHKQAKLHGKVKELHSDVSEQLTVATRTFIKRAYPTMKKHNPETPILIREATGVAPKVFARYSTKSQPRSNRR